ncbi:MAG: hypothetical protein JKY65_10425 [Planctomycetes bacterium]|nr:hypothetical protein [Planctomycetota bacterium]
MHLQHGFEIAGSFCPTCEHRFQAQKVAGTQREGTIRHARTAKEPKSLGQPGRSL